MSMTYLSNGHKIDQMTIGNIPTSFIAMQDPPKFTQIEISGLKTYHLATLEPRVLKRLVHASNIDA
jgi:hypothetical protein